MLVPLCEVALQNNAAVVRHIPGSVAVPTSERLSRSRDPIAPPHAMLDPGGAPPTRAASFVF